MSFLFIWIYFLVIFHYIFHHDQSNIIPAGTLNTITNNFMRNFFFHLSCNWSEGPDIPRRQRETSSRLPTRTSTVWLSSAHRTAVSGSTIKVSCVNHFFSFFTLKFCFIRPLSSVVWGLQTFFYFLSNVCLKQNETVQNCSKIKSLCLMKMLFCGLCVLK